MFLSKLEWLIDYKSKIAGKLHVFILRHSGEDWVVTKVTIRFTLVFKNMVCLAINYYFSTKKSIHLTF